MIIAKQNTEIVFYWADAGGKPDQSRLTKAFEEAQLGFGSTQQAVLFLRRYPELFSFRQLLNERYAGQGQVYRLEDLYQKLAADMVRRRLCVIKRWLPAVGSSSTLGAATVVPRREAVERTEPAEPPTFLPNNNNDAQAETLAGAASDGEPFCEECEKARLQAEASTGIPEPEPASFPPNHDGDSQSKTLIDAAKDGVPFCEECEKARLAKQAA